MDYLLERYGGSFVSDQYDPTSEYFQQQKIQTEKYYKQRSLNRLQQRLVSLTKQGAHGDAINFAGYIKEKTGYDIDFFEDLQKPRRTKVSRQGFAGMVANPRNFILCNDAYNRRNGLLLINFYSYLDQL